LGDWRYHPAVPWRAKCYECEQEAPITVPAFETLTSFAEGDLGHATATYEAHPRWPSDTRLVLRRQQIGSAVSDAQGALDNTR
jgi:hypothetical protein